MTEEASLSPVFTVTNNLLVYQQAAIKQPRDSEHCLTETLIFFKEYIHCLGSFSLRVTLFCVLRISTRHIQIIQ